MGWSWRRPARLPTTVIGLLQPGRDPANGYRLFTDAHLVRLNFIRNAKRLDYTLSEIRCILHHAGKGGSPCPAVHDIVHRRVLKNAECRLA